MSLTQPILSVPTTTLKPSKIKDVKNFYNTWKRNYVVRTSQVVNNITLYRIAFGKRTTSNYAATVSEGQGYGMMIVALMAGHDPNAKAIFDGLWTFVRAHPSSVDNRLMAKNCSRLSTKC